MTAPVSPPESPPRVVLLGTGTGLPDTDRDHTHLVWDGPGGPLLVDVGGGTYGRLLRAGIDPQTLTGVLLTHSHCDHINGLPDLLFSLWLGGWKSTETRMLPIYGLPETLDIARPLVTAAFLETVAAPHQWVPFQAGDRIPLPTDDWTLTTAPTVHSRPCVALRWDHKASGKSLTYSCDTEPCPTVTQLAQGTDILIHEATTPGPFDGHTSPRQAGEVAKEAGAKRLILVHYSAVWTMPEEQAVAEIKAGGFDGPAEAGRDGQEVFLPFPA